MRLKRLLLIMSALVLASLAIVAGLYKFRSIIWKHQQPTAPTGQVTATNNKPLIIPGAPDVPQTPPAPVIKHDASIPPVINGLAPVVSRLNTKEPVVFLTIDDGISKQPQDLGLMKSNNLVASLFLVHRFIKDKPDYFRGFVEAGSIIENHSEDHALLQNLTYDQQKRDICQGADSLEKLYNRRPVLFRPSGGGYNRDTQRAAAACGMKAVVLWSAKVNGGAVQFQSGHSLRAGDIVLMHFRPEFTKDIQAFVKAEKAAGLHTVLLEDWLGV